MSTRRSIGMLEDLDSGAVSKRGLDLRIILN